jgi:hypothetical protein
LMSNFIRSEITLSSSISQVSIYLTFAFLKDPDFCALHFCSSLYPYLNALGNDKIGNWIINKNFIRPVAKTNAGVILFFYQTKLRVKKFRRILQFSNFILQRSLQYYLLFDNW